MRKQIVYRDNMEALAADANAQQDYAQEWGDNLVQDFLQVPGARGYAGLRVTRKTSTTVTVAKGRLYDGSGRMFGVDAATDVDLTPYLPSVSPRIVAIVVYGQTVDAASVIRDFIDPVTEEAVPRQVYLESQRQVVITVVAGTEAGSPVAPAIASTYLSVALVRLSAAGIAAQASITQVADHEIGSLDDAFDRVESLEDWKKRTNSTISALRSDIADLSRLLKGLAGTTAISTLAKEVARLREQIGLPDSYSSSHADAYLTASESWTAHPSWAAKVEEGIRFADAGADEQTIGLLSSIDSAVTISAGGLMLPKYRDEISLSIGDQAKERDIELPISQYQTATISGDVLVLSRLRQRYGEDFVVCSNNRYWQTGEYDPVNGIFTKDGETWVVDDVSRDAPLHRLVRTTRFFQDDWADAYWRYGALEKSVTGKILAQTRLATATRWVTGYDLRFTQVAPAGDVTLLVCGVEEGKPDLTKIFAHVTVAAADLVEDGWTRFRLEPFVMVRGFRYAILVVTSGAHWVQVSNSNDYTQGTLFSFVDGDYAVALADKDLCFQEYVAKFLSTKTVVDLQPWSLAGGITGIDVLAPCWRSQTATLTWQFKANNKWWSLSEIAGASPFTGLPAMVQARCAMTHTHDIAPGIRLGTSRVRLTRPRTSGTAISRVWTTPAPITSVSMTILLSSFEAAHHGCVPKLRVGGGYATVVAASSVSTKVRRDGLTVMTAVFSGLAATSAYCWQFDVTTDSALRPFVIEEVTDAAL